MKRVSWGSADANFMRQALELARRGYGQTSPNPMVGALIVRGGKILGKGWHHRAGLPHAEIEALTELRRQGFSAAGATLYVTLEPCSTHGRTPPCTDAIISSGITRVVLGTIDPNPRHSGKAVLILRDSGIKVEVGLMERECAELNEAFNHWIVLGEPFVIVKAAMTLDGKIATESGDSKWITSAPARQKGMQLRAGADAILVGINTVLMDNPKLTVRGVLGLRRARQPRRIILDSECRTPLKANVVADASARRTTVVVGENAPSQRVTALARRVQVLRAPGRGQIELRWLLSELGRQGVTSILVEGGGEVNASVLMGGYAHRVAFFYAPKVLGGARARKAVAGLGATGLKDCLVLRRPEWSRVGEDCFLTARVARRR